MFNLNCVLEKINFSDTEILDLSNQFCLDYFVIPKYIEINPMGISGLSEVYLPLSHIISLTQDNLFACVSNYNIYIWNADSLRLVNIIKCEKNIISILSLPDGSLLIADSDNNIKLWHPETGTYLGLIHNFSNSVSDMKLIHDKIAILTSDGLVNILHTETKKLLYPLLNMQEENIKLMDIYKYQSVITAKNNNIIGQIYLNKISKQKLLNDGVNITALTVDPYNYLICGDSKGSIFIFNPASLKCEYSLKISQSKVNSLTVLPDGNIIASHEDAIQCIFHPENGRILQIYQSPSPILKFVVLSNGKLASIATNGLIYIWDFPKRLLKGDDVFLITEMLAGDHAVKEYNLTNIILDNSDIKFVTELQSKRPELSITGVPLIGINYNSYYS